MSIWLPKPHLSASQINGFEFCPRKYYYNNIEGIKIVTPALLVGKSAHTPLEAYYDSIIDGESFSKRDAHGLFLKEFNKHRSIVDDWLGKKESDYTHPAIDLLSLHIDSIAPFIDPVKIEEYFELDIDGIKIVGYIDLQTDKAIYDHKFRVKAGKPRLDPKTDLQLSLYAYYTGAKKVGFILHWLEKKRHSKRLVPQAGIFTGERNQKHIDDMKDAVKSTAEKITQYKEEGDFPRRENPRMCNTRNWTCEFYDRCWKHRRKTERKIRKTLQEIDKPATYIDEDFGIEVMEEEEIDLPF